LSDLTPPKYSARSVNKSENWANAQLRGSETLSRRRNWNLKWLPALVGQERKGLTPATLAVPAERFVPTGVMWARYSFQKALRPDLYAAGLAAHVCHDLGVTDPTKCLGSATENVRCWHLADLLRRNTRVRFRGKTGHTESRISSLSSLETKARNYSV
jgi:hypothetical protein